MATPTNAYTCMCKLTPADKNRRKVLLVVLFVYSMGVGLLSCLSIGEAVRRPKDGIDNSQNSPPFCMSHLIILYIGGLRAVRLPHVYAELL